MIGPPQPQPLKIVVSCPTRDPIYADAEDNPTNALKSNSSVKTIKAIDSVSAICDEKWIYRFV